LNVLRSQSLPERTHAQAAKVTTNRVSISMRFRLEAA
jgi:hypothetical protein